MRRKHSPARSQPSDLDPTPPMESSKRAPPRFSVAVLILFLVVFLVKNLKLLRDFQYKIIIDGGSTGTRIHVFASESTATKAGVELSKSGSLRGGPPGLSGYVDKPEIAAQALSELIEFGKRWVPEKKWKQTEIRLMATAGLRLVEVGVRERILEACRRVLRKSGFLFRDEWAMVISGSDEGIYAWVAANYALGTLGGDPEKTSGIIELGGASAQVTFVSSESLPSELHHELKYGNVAYNLYSQSFLHLGQNVAYESLRKLLESGVELSAISGQKRVVRDPCTPKGYILREKLQEVTASVLTSKADYEFGSHAYGNFTECRSAALMLLQKGKDSCLYKQCLLGSRFIPELQGEFVATENFFYTSKFFGLGPTAFLSDLASAGENFCGEDWMKLKQKHNDLDEEELVRYCFSSAYIVALLHDSLGIDLNDPRIKFTNQISNVPLDWALGAFIMLKASEINTEGSGLCSTIINTHPMLVYLVVVFAVLMLTVYAISRWRRYRLMTIYDMEKGRYIIKRISR